MRVWLTGGSGMLGTTIRHLAPQVAPGVTLLAPARAELDLADRAAVADWMAANPVDAVIHAAARVGGIAANIADPAGFLTANLRINDAVISGGKEIQLKQAPTLTPTDRVALPSATRSVEGLPRQALHRGAPRCLLGRLA